MFFVHIGKTFKVYYWISMEFCNDERKEERKKHNSE
jgi:hypothetical protein